MTEKTCYVTLTTLSGEIPYTKEFQMMEIFKKMDNEFFKKYKIDMEIVSNNHNDLRISNTDHDEIFFKKCGECEKHPDHSLKVRLLKNENSLGIFLNIPSCCGYLKCEEFLKDFCLFFNKIFETQSFFTISSQPEIFSENFSHSSMTLSELRENETFIRRIKVL